MHPGRMNSTLTPQSMTSAPAAKDAVTATLIVPFTQAHRSDVPSLGGKGANLGEMTAAGLPVPPGFVISIRAYEIFYAANELEAQVRAELGNVNADDPASLERSADSLRQLILDGEMPENLRDAIERAYDELVNGRPGVRVAVRSSATAEDTAEYSFAGMFESFLNIANKRELLDRVKA